MARLFVAAWPSDEVRRLLHGLPRPDLPQTRWVPARNWHVTLRFLGDADPAEVASRLRGHRFASATVTLGPATDRLGHQIVIPVAGADALAAAVSEATAGLGVGDRRPFRGHLTVARAKRRPAAEHVGVPFAAIFDIGEIALVASELHPQGAVYTTLATFSTDA